MTDADRDLVGSVVERAPAEGIDAAELLERGFATGIADVEEEFENEGILLPRLFMSSEAMQRIAGLLVMQCIYCESDASETPA